MAHPDAENVRLQNRNMNLSEEMEGSGAEIESSVSVFKDANDLSGNLTAIHGIVFSLDGFNHPGGEQIELFGGNDVTVQYKMIHLHHTSKQLKKEHYCCWNLGQIGLRISVWYSIRTRT